MIQITTIIIIAVAVYELLHLTGAIQLAQACSTAIV